MCQPHRAKKFTNWFHGLPSPNGAKYYVALTALWGGGLVVTIGLTPYPLLCHPYGVLEFLSPNGAK